METAITLEKQRVYTLAEEYRRKGYTVVEKPMLEQLPEFLFGYQPDLLVRKGNKTMIVEVKTRSSLTGNSQVRELARLLQAKPDWDFELVMVREGEKLLIPEDARPFERDDILQGIAEAERLTILGFNEAAFLLAWSTAEATIRFLTEEEDIVLDRPMALHLFEQAITNGVISRDDYNFLLQAVRYRNALVHGFKTADVAPALVQTLLMTTQRLLQSTMAS